MSVICLWKGVFTPILIIERNALLNVIEYRTVVKVIIYKCSFLSVLRSLVLSLQVIDTLDTSISQHVCSTIEHVSYNGLDNTSHISQLKLVRSGYSKLLVWNIKLTTTKKHKRATLPWDVTWFYGGGCSCGARNKMRTCAVAVNAWGCCGKTKTPRATGVIRTLSTNVSSVASFSEI